MPDIVQLADDKTGIEKQQQNDSTNFIPQPDLFCQKIQHHQKDTDDAAVHIGQAFFKIGLDGTAHIARHLPHGIQQSLQVVFLGNIQAEACWKFINNRLCGLQRPESGQFQNGGHSDGQNREEGNPNQVSKEFFPAAPPANLIHKEQQKNKNAGKQTNIIIGKNREEQRKGVQDKFLIPQQLHSAQSHQGQQRKGIQPHDIPLKAKRPGTQAIKATEHRNGQIVFPKNVFQENRKKESCKAQLDGNQQGKIFQQQTFRYQHAEKVQRRCQIIGNQAQVIHAKTHAPGIQQPLASPQRIPERYKEWIVLVIHVRI